MRKGALCLAAVFLATAVSLAGTARVTYLTGSSAYIDAGTRDGLGIGDSLEVVRDGATVAVLKVRQVSPGKASCSSEQSPVELAVGDTVRFLSRPAPAADRSSFADRMRSAGIRGRIGFRYLASRDRQEPGRDRSQPSLDLRLDGRHIAGGPWSMAVDVRARRITTRSDEAGEVRDGRTRVYRAAFGWDGRESPLRIAVGRQFSPELSAVSIFDGVSAGYDSDRWSAGAFSGTQPDAADYSFSSDIREHGVYVQFRGEPGDDRRWRLTTGAIGSYRDSEVNREFLYLQGRYRGPRLTLFATEEIDYNRDWKREAGEDTLSATSTFIHFHLRAGRNVTLRGGYDNRRNVRLHRFRITPESEFDDSYRTGSWLGASVKIREHFRAGLDARTGSGGGSGSADAITARFAAERIAGSGLSLRFRSTRYDNDLLEGWLHSLSAGVQVGKRIHLECTGGVREETGARSRALDDSVVWYGVDADFYLGKRWYAILSGERTDGDLEEYDLVYAGLTYRF